MTEAAVKLGGTWARLASVLTPEQRAEVVEAYRRRRLDGARPGEALTQVHGSFAVRCVDAVQAGCLEEAKVAAAQCAYEMDLQQHRLLAGEMRPELVAVEESLA